MNCPLCYFPLELDWDRHLMMCLLFHTQWVRFDDGPWLPWR